MNRGKGDQEDKRQARLLAGVLLVLVLALLVTAVLVLPALGAIIAEALEPGLGIRESAVIAFGLTMAVMVIFALAAGDGLLGEIQFMLGAFFLFFLTTWVLIAWVF